MDGMAAKWGVNCVCYAGSEKEPKRNLSQKQGWCFRALCLVGGEKRLKNNWAILFLFF